jgi:molecular chaperone GrpE (heat shock protein)
LRHEALEEVSGSGQPEGTIIGEAQRGYSFKGQVIRPSRVRVAGK